MIAYIDLIKVEIKLLEGLLFDVYFISLSCKVNFIEYANNKNTVITSGMRMLDVGIILYSMYRNHS